MAPLLVVWGFMGLMTREFGVREWLRRHPITVLWSHMLILPLIDLYATACDWMPSGAGRVIGAGLAWFLVASFFNGIVVELGRKIRAPADEETGVETYSALWGIRRASLAWLGAMACTLLFATLAAREVGAAWIVAGLLGAIGIAAVTDDAPAHAVSASREQGSVRSCSPVSGRSRCISASGCFRSWCGGSPVANWIAWDGPASEVGGKAASLAALAAARLPIPAWFAVRPPASSNSSGDLPADLESALDDAVRRLLRDAAPGERLAVRSSAFEEDGVRHSFAGQFESYLFVAPEDVPARVRDVWRSAESGRVDAYRKEHALEQGARLPAVLVQRMIDPDASGVAFSADPVSGQRGICVVDAVYGVGTSLVSGEANADSFRVDRSGDDRRPADLVEAQRASRGRWRRRRRRGSGGRGDQAGDRRRSGARRGGARARERRALRPAAGHRVGDRRRPTPSAAVARHHVARGHSLTPTAALALWDNSNITESYAGITTPLTFSFARYVYEEVYRQFCRIVGVPDERIADNADALRAMLGLVRGRIYYNLVSWYRLLALFPGY